MDFFKKPKSKSAGDPAAQRRDIIVILTSCITVLMCLLGAACFGVALYTIARFPFMYTIYDSAGIPVFRPSCYLLMIGGILLIFLVIVTCIVSMLNNWKTLFIFIWILVVPGVLLLLGGILGFVSVNQFWYQYTFEERMNNDVKNYYYQPGYLIWSYAWDNIQSYYQCCGVRDSSWNIYLGSSWYAQMPGTINFDKAFVPASCCTMDQFGTYQNLQQCQLFMQGPPYLQNGANNAALYYSGCTHALTAFVYLWGFAFGGLGIATGSLIAIGIILTNVYHFRYVKPRTTDHSEMYSGRYYDPQQAPRYGMGGPTQYSQQRAPYVDEHDPDRRAPYAERYDPQQRPPQYIHDYRHATTDA